VTSSYVLGVGSFLNFDFHGPLANRMTPKPVSPLVPFDFLIVALAPANAADLRDRESPRSTPQHHSFSKFRHNKFSS
jgi:hypothetical protein